MFSVGEIDVKGLRQFENMLGALGAEAPKAVNRAINRTGDMAKTQVVKELARQTGLPQKLIRRSVKVTRSSWTHLEYQLHSAGGDVSLKYFKKRETDEGVRAYLGDQRGWDWFAESFFRAGRWPRPRQQISWSHGHVFVRVGGRTDLEKVTSGVFIPIEMVEGATAKAFEDSVTNNLPRRLDHEISRALGL
ncbi:hypothetical protein DL1_03240 [Thioclava dalianensis]|uniref:Uncharacterized protein n=2 Tax=Thioclava dalianensis TaxID=1185766 RepID=A0A074THJ0_9RHOB|nr:phage tail protein [Thioclava dalianensis]KEP69620.1 hypothetical protein DL1_03240 [Thioclava dalianensis]SFN15930.1 Prophage minor tail protein Z (GPZ) [Thioclava dalianensis]